MYMDEQKDVTASGCVGLRAAFQIKDIIQYKKKKTRGKLYIYTVPWNTGKERRN